MTSYDQERNAIHIINPAVESLSKDLFLHTMTLVIDKYCSDRHMSCRQKCDFVMQIWENFEELRQNV